MTMISDRPALPDGVLLDDQPGKGYYRLVSTRSLPGVDEEGRAFTDVFKEKRPCKFPPAGLDDDGIENLKRQCHGEGVDFYDPRPCPGCDDGRPIGWLRFAKKPEHNHTINEGRLFEMSASERIYDDAPVAPASKGGPK